MSGWSGLWFVNGEFSEDGNNVIWGGKDKGEKWNQVGRDEVKEFMGNQAIL